MARDRIYTRTGDDGTTGLLYGGRVRKDSEHPTAYGTVDEVQAVLGLARASSEDDELSGLLLVLERDLWVVMAELATKPANRSKLTPGTSLVTVEMVERASSQAIWRASRSSCTRRTSSSEAHSIAAHDGAPARSKASARR